MKIPDDLKPGDNLIMRPHTLFGCIEGIKCWHWNAAHCELWAGNGKTFAARAHLRAGVNVYEFEQDHLAYVLRPDPPFDFYKAEAWFYKEARGQGYDFFGLVGMFTTVLHHSNPNKQWCSELLTRLDRAGGCDPFSPLTDADTVAPFQFLTSSKLKLVWCDGKDPRAVALLRNGG